jgi:hypothetical protein
VPAASTASMSGSSHNAACFAAARYALR